MTTTGTFQLPLATEWRQGLQNLLAHKLRTFLTMLGMIFGVAAVVTMVSIGAGAQREVLAYIEDLGVRNVIVEALEANDPQTFNATRRVSPGLTFQDLRSIQANVPGLVRVTPRKRFTPTKVMPKPVREAPVVFGVETGYREIANLRIVRGRFFDDREAAEGAAVCVLGEGARTNLFGGADPIGQHVKIGEQWFRVVGEAGPQLTVASQVQGLPAQDRNNLIYVPTAAAIFRLEDTFTRFKDEIDGLYLTLNADTSPVQAGAMVRSLVSSRHRGATDFTVLVPAELLAEQQRARRVFEIVMVALASISLLVGGIGIMNIMLATVLERTKEIGLRRAVGARYYDIVRQFLLETLIICLLGGAVGLVFGVGLSRVIALAAGWSTIVTPGSVMLAFAVSVSVGLIFGVYPAMKAARLDPVVALHDE